MSSLSPTEGLRRLACVRPVSVAVSIFLSLGGQTAYAAETTFDASLTQRVEYNDNVTLSDAGSIESATSITTPEFRLVIRTPAHRTSFHGSFDIGRFANNSRENYESQRGTFSTSFSGQRSNAGLTAGVAHVTTLESEETDTGRVDIEGRRLDYWGNPYFSYDLTQRSTLKFDAMVSYVEYYDTLLLEDYRQFGGGIDYLYKLGEVDRLGIRGNFRRYENLVTRDNESDTYSGKIVWSRDVSEQVQSEFSLGPEYSRRTYSDGISITETRTWGATLEGKLDWQATERSRLSATLSRAMEPSGTGATNHRSKGALDFSYRATEFIDIGFHTYFQLDANSSDPTTPDRRYFSARPTLSWQFTRNWWVSGGYQYRWQQYDSAPTAQSNMAFISLSLATQGWKSGN